MGVHSIGWRYDPILISEDYPIERHIEDFEKMASTLSGYTNTFVISFIDLYQKVLRNFPEVQAVKRDDRVRIAKEFVRIAEQHGMTIKSCAEGVELEAFGVDCSGCLLGCDIGAYNTCAHLCKYCYANYDVKTVLNNMENHNPKSPLLLGNLLADDMIHEAKQESWRDMQLRLF